MKKLLMVVSIILMLSFVSSMVFGTVSVRLRKIDHTPGATETLVVVAEQQSTNNYAIVKFQGAFNIGDMYDNLTGGTPVDFTHEFFSTYTTTTGYDTDGWVHWEYTAPGVAKGDTLNINKNSSINGWQEMFRVTFTYTQDFTEFAGFHWAPTDYIKQMLWYISAFGIDWDVWANELVDAELNPHQLPVEMGNISAIYSSKEGVHLTWNTLSEVDNAGFNIKCKYLDLSGSAPQYVDRIVGSVKGVGNSSTGETYTFTDRYAPADQDILYTVHSINSLTGEEDGFYHIYVVTTSPEHFTMYQNYPNPFNPATNIVYVLKDAAFVKLNIYNILGQKVRTLVNTYQEANRYPVTWDGLNDAGNVLPSGVYVYKVQAGDNVQIKKMIKLQ